MFKKRNNFRGKAPVSKPILLTFIILALIGPLISNNKPLMELNNKQINFPALQDLFSVSPSKNIILLKDVHFAIYTLIPYSPKQIDLYNSNYVSPFAKQTHVTLRNRHWLGTDLLGRDVLSGLIYGSRIALMVGFFSMIVSFIIGVLLGSIAGYWGDDKLRINIVEFFLIVFFLLYFITFIFSGIKFEWRLAALEGIKGIALFLISKIGITALSLICFAWILKMERRLLNNFFKSNYTVPVDFIITRIIEVFEAIPIMFLIIALMAVIKPSLVYVILIIGFTAWPPIAKYTRAEFLKTRKLDFVEAAKSLGYSDWRIMFRHIFPNAINPILVALTFGVANAILAESTLSFLGIGLAADEVTWGSMLAGARQAPEAWWLVLFPGLMIFLLVWALNNFAETLMLKLDKRLALNND